MPFTWFRDFCEETHFFGQLPEKFFFDKCHPQHDSTNFVEKYPPLPLNLFQLYSIPFGVKIFKWRYPDTHLSLLRISLFHSFPSFLMNQVSRDKLYVTDHQHNQATRYHLPMAKTEQFRRVSWRPRWYSVCEELCLCFFITKSRHRFQQNWKLGKIMYTI